jgi:O-antigen ligase
MLFNRVPVESDLIRYLDQAIFGSLLIMVFFIPLTETGKSVFFGFALFFWICKAWVTRDFRIKIPWLGWFFLAWLGVVIVSSVFSECRLSQGIPGVLLYTVFFFLIINTVKTEGQIWSLIWMVLLGLGLGDVWGISYYVFSEKTEDVLHILSLGETPGYLVMALSLILALLMYGTFNTKQRIFIWVVFLLSQMALVFTSSRTMLFAFVCVVLTSVLFGGNIKRTTVVGSMFVLLLLIGYFLNPMVKSRVDQIIGPDRWANLELRLPVWRSALLMAQDHPLLGVGHKCFKPTKEKYNDRYKVADWAGQAHSLPLHVAAELGLLGVIALFAWLGASVYYLKARNHFKSVLARILRFAGLGSLVAILLGGLANIVIGAEVSLLFLMIMGLLIVTENIGSAHLRGN